MSDSNDGLTRRQQLAWVIVAFLVVSSTAAIAENFTGGFNTYESPGILNASAGPAVTLGQDFQLEGGQPATDASVNLSKQDGAWMNVSGEAGGSSLTVDTVNSSATASESWTNVSSADVSAANVTLQPSDKNFTTIGGGVTAFKYQDPKVDDGETDAIYTSSGTGTLVFETDATDGTQYGLVDPNTNEGFDVATAQSDGTIHFTEVPAGTTQEVAIEELGVLTVREELVPHSKVTGCTIGATFFELNDNDNPTILNKTDTDDDGEIELTGLPVDDKFAVQIQCAGYHNRTIVLPDLSQQETVYLLNKSDDTVTVTFDIQDNTGKFSEAGTEFVVQRAINRSIFDTGGFVYDNMAGDEIGASGSARHVLNKEARYRLKITNQEGETRILGAHVADANQTIAIRINDVDLEADESQGYNWNFTRINSSGTIFVQFTYVDNEDETTKVELTIHEFGNESNVLHDDTHIGTYGTLQITEQVTGDDKNTTWVADFTATRNGTEITGSQVSGRSTNPLGVPLDDAWKNRIALLSLILIGFIVGGGVSPEVGGIAVVAAAGMWHYIGWMPADVTAVSIGIASLIAVASVIGTRRGEPVG